MEISEAFTSLDDWTAWSEDFLHLKNPAYIEGLVQSICATGFIDPCYGFIPGHEVVVETRNFRESLKARGCTSRYRALLKLALDHVLGLGWCSTIYLAEHLSAFAETLSARFPYVLTSEYIENPIIRMRSSDTRHEDPMCLSLPDRSFDLYLSADAMVYAPDMDRLLREAHRILRRGGIFLATFPFRYGEPDTEILAQIVNGETVHRRQPVFHHDPVSGTRTRLLYLVPGWDIVEAARAAGFASAEIVVQGSRTHAIVGSEIAAIFVLRAKA